MEKDESFMIIKKGKKSMFSEYKGRVVEAYKILIENLTLD